MNKKRHILVVGSGVSGYAAAVAAAESGGAVTVVDKACYPGGQCTHVNVGTICGLFIKDELIEHPFLTDFYKSYCDFDEQAKVINHAGYPVLSYDWKRLSDYFSRKLTENKVEILSSAQITGIQTSGDRITEVLVEKDEKEFCLAVDAVIDCTGKAVVTEFLGTETICSDNYQAPAYIFELSGVSANSEFQLQMTLSRFAVKMDFPSLYVVPGSFKAGKVMLKLALKVAGTDDENQKEQLLVDTQKFVQEKLLPELKEQTEAFGKATISVLFPEMGWRTGKRPKGKKILTENDLTGSSKSSDFVAVGAWPMEEWKADGQVEIKTLAGVCYGIPAGCLRHNTFDNLFMAGKNISADERAISSARVTGTCLQTGFAAGKMAGADSVTDLDSVIKKLYQTIEHYF